VIFYICFLSVCFVYGLVLFVWTLSKDIWCCSVVDMHAEGRLLSCDQSIDRLVEILSTNRFHSGAHIDYYDEDWQSFPLRGTHRLLWWRLTAYVTHYTYWMLVTFFLLNVIPWKYFCKYIICLIYIDVTMSYMIVCNSVVVDNYFLKGHSSAD